MFQTLNGIRVQYQLNGPKEGPALVLLHGFPFSSAMWEPQLKAFSAGFRVLTYDLRGMGKSSLGLPPQLLESYVDDLLDLMDSLGIKAAALCGLSMGGYIALRAAEREPARAWALVLCDTRADADGDQAKIGRAAGIRVVRAKGPLAFSKGMLPKLLAPLTLRNRPAVGRVLLKMMGKTSPDGMANALAAMAGRSDTHAGLRLYPGPVLTLSGSLDLLAPPTVARAMAAEAREGRFVEIAGAGHVSNMENPAVFNKAVLNFLRQSLPV